MRLRAAPAARWRWRSSTRLSMPPCAWRLRSGAAAGSTAPVSRLGLLRYMSRLAAAQPTLSPAAAAAAIIGPSVLPLKTARRPHLPPPTAMRAVWQQTVAKEGLMSVYRGFGVAVGSTFVYKGLYFSLYVSPEQLPACAQLPPGPARMLLAADAPPPARWRTHHRVSAAAGCLTPFLSSHMSSFSHCIYPPGHRQAACAGPERARRARRDDAQRPRAARRARGGDHLHGRDAQLPP